MRIYCVLLRVFITFSGAQHWWMIALGLAMAVNCVFLYGTSLIIILVLASLCLMLPGIVTESESNDSVMASGQWWCCLRLGLVSSEQELLRREWDLHGTARKHGAFGRSHLSKTVQRSVSQELTSVHQHHHWNDTLINNHSQQNRTNWVLHRVHIKRE